MNSPKMLGGKAKMTFNVQYQLRDKDGNAKKMFQQNWLYTKLMKLGWLNPFSYEHAGLFQFMLGGWNNGLITVRNTTTNVGFAAVAGRINGSGSPAAFTYIAVGTGTNAASASDTALQTELSTSGLSRAAGSVSLVTTTQTNDTAQIVLTYTVTGTQAVTESGLFNAASSVTLLARQVFSAINVVNGDSLQVTWKIKVS